MRRLILVAAFSMGGLLLLPLQPASASCAEDSGPAGAPVIFVGTAGAERRGFTRFTVEEVRAGPDLAPEVWVLSGQEQATWPLSLVLSVRSSVDAQFTIGDQYVVGANRSFVTNACRASSAEANDSRPDAREPIAAGAIGVDPPLGPVGQTIWVAVILGFGAAVVGLLRRFRRRAPGTTVTSA